MSTSTNEPTTPVAEHPSGTPEGGSGTNTAPRRRSRRSRLAWVRSVGWCLAFASMCFCGWMLARLWREQGKQPVPQPAALQPGAQDADIVYQQDPETGKLVPVDPEALQQAKQPAEAAPLADFRFTERSGKVIARDDLLGHPWTVNFIFTRCAGECLRLSASMYELQEQIKDLPVRMVTFTVDPEFDTLPMLQNYADAFGADAEKWLYLRSNDRDYLYGHLRGTFRQLVMELEGNNRRPGYEFLHTSNVLHISADGRIVGNYNGLDAGDMLRLQDALREEVEELKAAGKLKPLSPIGRQPGPAVAESPN